MLLHFESSGLMAKFCCSVPSACHAEVRGVHVRPEMNGARMTDLCHSPATAQAHKVLVAK